MDRDDLWERLHKDDQQSAAALVLHLSVLDARVDFTRAKLDELEAYRRKLQTEVCTHLGFLDPKRYAYTRDGQRCLICGGIVDE